MNLRSGEQKVMTSAKTAIIGLGLVLGVAMGVGVSFVALKFTDWTKLIHNQEAALKEPSDDHRDIGSSLTSSEVITFLQSVLGMSADSDSILEQFDQQQLLSLADLISTTEQPNVSIPDYAKPRLIVSELVQFDPQLTLELIEYLPVFDRSEAVQVVFAIWSFSDLPAALQAVNSVNASMWSVAVRTMLETRPDEFERIEEYAEALGYSKQFEDIVQAEETQRVMSSDPFAAWHMITQDTVPDNEQIELLRDVVSTLMYQNGLEVLDQIFESRHRLESNLLDSLLHELVQHQPQDFFQHALTLPRDKQSWLLPIIFAAWSDSNPQEALGALDRIEQYNVSTIRSRLIHDWARSEPLKLLAELTTLSPAQRSKAATSALTRITKQNPQIAQEILFNWSDVSGVRLKDLQVSFVQNWARQNPEETYRWLSENVPANEEVHAYMLSLVLSSLSEEEPEKAISIALSQPDTSHYVQGQYFDHLVSSLGASGHIDLVISMLDQVPEKALGTVVNEITRNLVHEGRWDEVIQQGSEITENERMWYFDRLGFHGSRENVQELLDRLDSLPSDDVRSVVVRRILSTHRLFGNLLTDSQRKDLESLSAQLPEVEWSPW
ncbi:MAG: hypothetical protein OXH31_00160 [Gammaproteobacteria bacterium]|nr:hypothetical protein [Gammaproteobacteria bacterium]